MEQEKQVLIVTDEKVLLVKDVEDVTEFFEDEREPEKMFKRMQEDGSWAGEVDFYISPVTFEE